MTAHRICIWGGVGEGGVRVTLAAPARGTHLELRVLPQLVELLLRWELEKATLERLDHKALNHRPGVRGEGLDGHGDTDGGRDGAPPLLGHVISMEGGEWVSGARGQGPSSRTLTNNNLPPRLSKCRPEDGHVGVY